ncbi:MAG TPA: ABC transporter permease [Puia sp.]|uniref:ABC transporter permease n=1 Tax=Puia sp. TaxID=2045100 RepID=UPI002C0BC9C3|nr:ABC transporter permease [Puia sp.]HVU98613.1 ABC transporter permease [Puia sp.]
MLINYLTIAWRNLTRNRVYSIINILGLALGMAIVLLIGAWINDELRYNKSFANYSRIVDIRHHSTHNGHTQTRDQDCFPLAGKLREQYAADFKRVAVNSFPDGHILQREGADPIVSTGIFAQSDLADIVSLRMLAGSSSLEDPSSMLLSRSQARALFGEGVALNKSIRMDNKMVLKVTGIYEDIPENSDWKGRNYIVNWTAFEQSASWVKGVEGEWNANSFGILAELQPGADVERVNARIRTALDGHGRNDKPVVLAVPMSRWHLYGEWKEGRNTGGAIRYLRMFGSIGVFVLLLACINFMNLATARSERRAREVGIRKSIGSMRGQLVLQFLGESLLMAMLAAGLAVLLAELALPGFSALAGSRITLELGWRFWAVYSALTLLVGVIAGSYPALYLSSFNPVKVLKGTFRAGAAAAIPRKALIVLQFVVSISLIIGTVVVFRQIAFVKNRPVGYALEGLLSVEMNTDDLVHHFRAIRDELLETGAVVDITQSTNTPTGGAWQQSGFNWAGKDPNVTPGFDISFVTPEFGKTLGWQVVKGRDFSRQFATDSAAILVNEVAAKYLGFKEPVGSVVNYLYSSRADNRYRIIGVVKDMVMRSPEETVKPAIYMIDTSNSNWILVKANPARSLASTIPVITSVFHKYNPGAPFDFRFESESYARKFLSEERVLRLAVFFTVFAIFISCLGLFGLASFMAEQRVREIGVRKVLGASVPQLWALLSREFVRLVGIAFLIAAPMAWMGMNRWLAGYDYRTTVGVSVFIYTFGLALSITLLTVSWQAVRAATANPVRALRSE